MENEKLIEINNNVINTSSQLENIIKDIVSEYMSDLDSLVSEIKEHIYNDFSPNKGIIEQYFKQLSLTLYFTSANVESFGIKDSVSKNIYKDKYNKVYLECSSDKSKEGKKTANEITAFSENESLHESAINDMYSKAYKIMKAKLDSAQTVVSTLSKIYSNRMDESKFESNNEQKTTRMILNEEVPF